MNIYHYFNIRLFVCKLHYIFNFFAELKCFDAYNFIYAIYSTPGPTGSIVFLAPFLTCLGLMAWICVLDNVVTDSLVPTKTPRVFRTEVFHIVNYIQLYSI